MFYHLPENALRAAALRSGATLEPGANKLRLYGLEPEGLPSGPDAFVWADNFKNWQDQAPPEWFSITMK